MKNFLFAAILAIVAAPSMATDVGVSVNVGQPGFYGQINIGDFPRPAVIYSQPVVIQPAPRFVGEPIYLRVPPGHAKKWSKHCHAYNACGRPVYFVQDNWYNNVYVPQYRAHHDGHHENHDHGDRDRHDEHGDRGDHDDNGKHHGKGNKHGKGHGNH